MPRYAIDEKNRLVITQKGAGPVAVHGRYSIDGQNRLSFTVDEPDPWRRRYDVPGQMVFEGAWQLDDNHDLVLVIAGSRPRTTRDVLTIKGRIISAQADALIFEITSWDSDGLLHAQLLKLSVVWSAGSANRLMFTLRHTHNSVLLESSWQLNQDQQITYRYEKFDLVRKDRVQESLVFEGYWHWGDSRKLTYYLGCSAESKFEFRAQVETPTIYPKQGALKYRLGLGLRQRRVTGEKILCLYGAWKISRVLRLTFSMDYGPSGIRVYEFASDIIFSKRDTVTFALKDSRGEPLGLELVVTHRFIRAFDAEVFARLQALRDQYGAYVGMRIAF